MLSNSYNFLYKLILAILLIFINITGIIQLFFNGAIAEGVVVLLTILLMGALLLQKTEFDFLDYAFIFVVIYSIIITIIAIGYLGIEQSAMIGFYYFVIPCIIFINRKSKFFENNLDFYFKLFLIIIILNSIWAIYQTIDPNNLIYPTQIGTLRVRGLMKSTLNYSGILGACFYPLLFYNLRSKILKICSFIILSIGAFLTISKGFFINIIVGFFASFPAQAIINKKITKRFVIDSAKYILIGLLMSCIAIIVINKNGSLDKYEQLINIANFTTNGANIERYDSWSSFGDYFFHNPFGYGFGQVTSGTTFVKHGINFESYILDCIYCIGIVSFIYFMIPIIYVYNLRTKMKTQNYQKYLMFFIGIVIQNLLQVSMLTPATTVISWFNLIFLANYFIRDSVQPKNINNIKKVTIQNGYKTQ